MTDADELPNDVWARINWLSSTGSEANIARRLRLVLAERGWSQDAFAAKVRAEGVRFPQSAISKILKPQGEPRAITVDEACAFARVLDIPLAELVLPDDVYQLAQVVHDMRMLSKLYTDWRTANDDYQNARSRLLAFLAQPEDEEQSSGARQAILHRLEQARTARDRVPDSQDAEGASDVPRFAAPADMAWLELLEEWERRQ